MLIPGFRSTCPGCGSTLTVEFHTGRIYDHPHVPPEVFKNLLQAESKGAFYNRRIRGKYR